MKFNHYCKANKDSRCINLIGDLGYRGYGLYWGLVEKLLNTADYSLPTSSIPELASCFGVKQKTLYRLIYDYDLFELFDNQTRFRSTPRGIHQFPKTTQGLNK